MFSVRVIVLASALVALAAGQAAAEDCFPKIRAAEARAAPPARKAAPHHAAAAPARPRVHQVRHVVKRARPQRVRVAAAPSTGPRQFVESSLAMQARPIYLPRPVSCDKTPTAAIQSPPPAGEKPPAQVLLDELAGPAEIATAPELPAGSTPGPGPDDAVDGLPTGPQTFFPGVQVGGGVFQPPGGGQPPVLPPDGGQPPVVTPPILPPPILPPDGGQPPIVFPPGPPPETGQPPIAPPDGGQPPVSPPTVDQPILPPAGGQPPGVPEPATWAMLILGVFGAGAVVRRRRALRRQATTS